MTLAEWITAGCAIFGVAIPVVGTCAWVVFTLRSHLTDCVKYRETQEKNEAKIDGRQADISDRLRAVENQLSRLVGKLNV